MTASAALPRKTLAKPGTAVKKSAARPKAAKKSAARVSSSVFAKMTRNGAPTSIKTKKAPTAEKTRTSQVLRNLLANHPDVTEFTVEQIVSAIGETSFGTSLMFFAVPEVIPIPVPGLATIVVMPTAVIAGQMAMGHQQIRLPRFIQKKMVTRKALAAAIHAVLPFLEKAEKVAKPRWKWATTPLAKRLLGVFIFILALSIAFPMPGFNMPQAISTFIIALGLVEEDGLLIAAGVLAGLASLALLGGAVFGVFSFLGLGRR